MPECKKLNQNDGSIAQQHVNITLVFHQHTKGKDRILEEHSLVSVEDHNKLEVKISSFAQHPAENAEKREVSEN